jgi:hypothetical protein
VSKGQGDVIAHNWRFTGELCLRDLDHQPEAPLGRSDFCLDEVEADETDIGIVDAIQPSRGNGVPQIPEFGMVGRELRLSSILALRLCVSVTIKAACALRLLSIEDVSEWLKV